MEINCKFETHTFYSEILYTCYVTEANITEKDHVIKEFKGVHKKGKTHKDIKYVSFWNTNVDYFPQGLHKHFPNLTHLNLFRCGIREISKSDLRGLEGLVGLLIQRCQLQSLPDDLFAEMPKFREVSFYHNNIWLSSSEALRPLLGRENVKVDLCANRNIDACSWPEIRTSLKSLEELMKLIDEKCSKRAQPKTVPGPVKPDLPEDFGPVDFNEKIKDLWVSGRFSDLTIIAGEKKFKVHKNILGIQSEVFAQIIEGQPEATEIKIPDVRSGSVEALLKFIYTNEASEDGNAKEIFEISAKFKVATLKSFYEKIICDQIDETNAWETFLFAHKLSSQLLKERAFQELVKIFPEEISIKLMDDPEKLKKLIAARKAYEEMLEESKPEET